MNKRPHSSSLRSAVEKALVACIAALIVTFVSAGTAVMCFPNIV